MVNILGTCHCSQSLFIEDVCVHVNNIYIRFKHTNTPEKLCFQYVCSSSYSAKLHIPVEIKCINYSDF